MVHKDRTGEFLACAETISKTAISSPPRKTQSPFFVGAKQISRDIYATHEKLEKLAKLASSTSLFNDPVHDIQELTYMIKKDIANLNKKIEGVKALANKKNQQSQQNSDNVMGNLSLKLQDTTKQFRKVLATRSENYKKQQASRKQFTGKQSTNNKKADAGSALYNPNIGQNMEQNHQAQAQDQMLANPLRYDGQARLDAIQDIERTMTDLNKIMVDISIMVEEQQVVMERIDNDVDNAAHHVDGAQEQLIKILQNVSSDRGLILKMFFILVVFCVIFFMFFV
mmetsp:Transcript_21058/g.32146  ORF Transcript_21058/g.32146 Transcript_21058/m.32146 type:complete len:283 (+) Transcript_21058:40-888(+)